MALPLGINRVICGPHIEKVRSWLMREVIHGDKIGAISSSKRLEFES